MTVTHTHRFFSSSTSFRVPQNRQDERDDRNRKRPRRSKDATRPVAGFYGRNQSVNAVFRGLLKLMVAKHTSRMGVSERN